MGQKVKQLKRDLTEAVGFSVLAPAAFLLRKSRRHFENSYNKISESCCYLLHCYLSLLCPRKKMMWGLHQIISKPPLGLLRGFSEMWYSYKTKLHVHYRVLYSFVENLKKQYQKQAESHDGPVSRFFSYLKCDVKHYYSYLFR